MRAGEAAVLAGWAPAPRSGGWRADPGFGVYVHIPFCAKRCHYCDFNTYEGLDELHAPYVDALVADILRADPLPAPDQPLPVLADEGSKGGMRGDGAMVPAVAHRGSGGGEAGRRAGGRAAATSVFFGGGTPTLLSPEELGRVLAAVASRFGIAPDAEVTVEANPETVDEAYFEALLAAGFNRVSIGVQSLVDRVLAGLGRTHGARAALDAIAAARRAGFADVNADLIYGSPWETDEDWIASLEGVIAAGPDHVSAYALTVEEATPLHTLVATGRVPDVDPDVQAARHGLADELLAGAGYERYEVSNWARRGHASRHNVLYWSAGDYAAFGAGAHGHIAGRRWWTMRLPRDYVAAVAAGESTEAGSERLDDAARVGEALMLGLRLRSGIDVAAFERRFGAASLAARRADIARLVEEGLLEESGGRVRLASGTTMVANEALCRLL